MNTSHTDHFVSSLHRAILGGFVAVFGLIALGTLFRSLSSGDYLIGIASLGLLLGCIFWLFHLFKTGVSEGRPSQERPPERNREDDEPLAELRNRYARGELSDTEFERKAEALLETEPDARSERESVEDARLRE